MSSLTPGWQKITLSLVSSIRYGLGVPPALSEDGVPMIRATNIKRGRIVSNGLLRIRLEDIPRRRNAILREGEILVVRSGAYTGDSALVTPEWEGSVAGYDLIISPTEFVDSAYLAFWLLGETAHRYFLGQRDRSAQPHINRQQLGGMELTLPPLSEQRQIAKLLSAAQRAIDRQEQLIALTAELKKALMHKLFTEGTHGEPLKQTEIGPVPQSWEIVPLGSIAKIGNGSTPKRDNLAYWKDGTIPWLTSGKIHQGRITDPDQYVTEAARAECHLPLVAGGSLLVAITGEGKTLGNAALVEFETCVSQHLAYVQLQQPDALPAFFLYFLQRQYSHLRQMSAGAGSTKRALTCGLLKRYGVPMAPKDEQKMISSILDAVGAKLRAHERLAVSLRTLFRTLLRQLMTAQIRIHDLDLSAFEEAEERLAGTM